MLLALIFVKIIVSIVVVVGLSLIAEHVSPKVAGILSGCPIGSAIALFFFGLEVSPEFAANSAIYNIVGLIATTSFIYFYYKSSKYFTRFNITLSSLIAILGYFVVAWMLQFIEFNRLSAVLISIAFMFLFIRLFKEIENVGIKDKIKLGRKALFIRALFAASLILLITGVPEIIGPTWAGIFSAFPLTVFPLILIMHSTYGKKRAYAVIKNVPVGVLSVIFYSLTLSIVYPIYGIYWGTLISYIIAAIYLIAYYKIETRIRNK